MAHPIMPPPMIVTSYPFCNQYTCLDKFIKNHSISSLNSAGENSTDKTISQRKKTGEAGHDEPARRNFKMLKDQDMLMAIKHNLVLVFFCNF